MKGKSLFVAALAAACLWSARPAGAKPVESAGKVEAVTVYRGQAMVTRLVKVEAPVGAVELVVGDLPAMVLGDSLFASVDEGAKVRAVRFRTRAVAEEPVEELRKLQQQTEAVQKEMRAFQARQALLARQEAYIANLETFAAGKAKDDLDRGTLDAKGLEAITELVFTKREKLSADTLELAEKMRDAEQMLNLLQRQRIELAARSTRTIREAVVFLDKAAAGAVPVRLTYLVNGAGWSPTYNARAKNEDKALTLEYGALIQQTSGEDWDNVKLTLSTATPAMLAEAPILVPLWVTLSQAPGQGLGNDFGGYVQGQKAANARLQEALRSRGSLSINGVAGPQAQFEQDYRANEAANRMQILDLVAGKDVVRQGREMAGLDEVLSVNYPMPEPISIPSRSDQQMIRIANLSVPASFYFQAAPVLTPYVYRQADVTNSSEIALLPGPVNSYLDGQFVGVGQVPLVAKGQRFTVGFGVDSQLRVTRELADKTDRVVGGNRELIFTYRLLVDNYRDKPAIVRVLDRLPDPRGVEIRVTLGEVSQALSDDPVYLRTIRKSGILRWEIEIPANSSGAKAKTIDYSYKLEFDRNLHLAEPSAQQVEQQKLEFQDKLKMMQQAK